jgi:hypothetical protein
MTAHKHASRAHTKEEARDMVLGHVRDMARYWSSVPGKTPRERCDGLAFSMLVMIDGHSSNLPAMDLVLRPHEDDKPHHIANGENYFEPGMAINDDVLLHDLYFKERLP